MSRRSNFHFHEHDGVRICLGGSAPLHVYVAEEADILDFFGFFLGGDGGNATMVGKG